VSFLLKWTGHFFSYKSEGLRIKLAFNLFRISSLLPLSNLVYSLTFLRHSISAAGILLKICTSLNQFHFRIELQKLSFFIKLRVCLSSFLQDLISHIWLQTNVYTYYLVCVNLRRTQKFTSNHIQHTARFLSYSSINHLMLYKEIKSLFVLRIAWNI